MPPTDDSLLDHLLTYDQLSARLGVPVATLRFWRACGDGPPGFRLGRRVVFPEADVEAYLRTQRDLARQTAGAR